MKKMMTMMMKNLFINQKNTFALLCEDDDDEEENAEENDEEEKSDKDPSSEENDHNNKTTTKKFDKKSRNTKKKQQKKKPKKKESKKEEDLDQILEKYSHHTKENKIIEVKKKETALLSVQPQFLNPETEEKKLFGANIIKQAHQQEGRGNRGRGNVQRHRKTILIRPKDSWPPITSDMDMELIDSKDGVNYFKVVWSVDYHHTQQTFFQCVESGDPNTLTALLQHHPYHVDSMLQLCEACKLTGQLDMVVDLTDRILYRFETCWHTLFRPTRDTNGRLEYSHPENRSFFIALFKYIQILDRRGCSRTALELCKVLLNMDHSDPLGVLLMIDNYAIRSRELSFLLDLSFSEQFESNISVLPNFVYNSALAKFLCEDEKKEIDTKGLSSTKSLLSATELLQSAIILFPTVSTQILMKLGVNSVIVKDKGQSYNIFEHPFFLNTSNLPDVPPLIATYIARNYQLWKYPNVTEWLTETLKSTFINSILTNDPMIINYQVLIEEAYKEKSDKFLKHHLLSEISEVLSLLPSQTTRNGLEIYDPVEIPREIQEMNPLALFFRSLLPWGDPLMRQQPPPAWLNNLMAQMGLNPQNPQNPPH